MSRDRSNEHTSFMQQLAVKRRSILIYNPISNHGHLDSWNALFIAFLLERGWRVIALTPAADALRARLALKQLVDHKNLWISEWGHPQRSLFERIRGRLKRIGVKLIQALLPTNLASFSFDANVNSEPLSKESDPEANYLLPTEFAQRVRTALQKSPWRANFLFNMYMDLYRTDIASWQLFNAIQKMPWAGIRFVPRPLELSSANSASSNEQEAYFQLKTLRGMCFLDAEVCSTYQNRLPDKTFGYLPDMTEVALPEVASSLAKDLKARASGRTIVFLGGSIGGKKNLTHWARVIELADPAKWFFVQIGEVFENTLSLEEQTIYRQLQTSSRENFFMKAEYLPDERAFNEIILASDILFAVYRNFTISSNMLGKAAAFNKPILVAQGHLMGQRVEQYQIGRTVHEDDPTQMLEQLIALAQEPPSPDTFVAYRQDFSHEALCHHFFNFLDKAVA
jgi:hypothetical protein